MIKDHLHFSIALQTIQGIFDIIGNTGIYDKIITLILKCIFICFIICLQCNHAEPVTHKELGHWVLILCAVP